VYQEMGQRRTFLNTMAEKMNSSSMPETAKVLRRMAMTDIKPGMDIPAPDSQTTTNGQQTTTQEDIPQTDATAGAIPTPSDASMAPEGQGGADAAAPGVTARTTFSDTTAVMAGDENLQMEFDAIMDYHTPSSVTIDVEGQEVPSRASQPLLGNTDVQQTQPSVQTSESSNMDVLANQSPAPQAGVPTESLPTDTQPTSRDGGSAAVQVELPGTTQPRQRSLSSMRAEVVRRIEEVQSNPQTEGNTARLTQLLGKIENRMMEDTMTRA
jgi:hypothetical protein